MTQQKSEDRIVPEGQGNLAPTHGVEPRGGGKAIPVKGACSQSVLPFAPAATGDPVFLPASSAVSDLSAVCPAVEPKADVTTPHVNIAHMDEVVKRLYTAFAKVAANQGAPGPDRQSIEEVRANLTFTLRRLHDSLLDGSYRPGDIRRVWIPKGNGKQRGLGIPNVIDRVVQEAVREVLEPVYEPTFHPSSHGFRPKRGCQTAIAEAQQHVASGYHYVVDMDLDRFFDRVHHQRLLARLSDWVVDRRVLRLIGQFLKAQVVLPDGVRVSTDEGVPQGGPLSPLLSNIVLDELDGELSRRDHRFVRYADDIMIYVRSARAGHRVMASLTHFISKRLRLKVNADKSAVAPPDTRHFLGYRLVPHFDGSVGVLPSDRSEARLRAKVCDLTQRSRGQSLHATIADINRYLRGWFGHFSVCTPGMERLAQDTDAHIRRRLRAIVLKQWKRKRSIARRLIRLGVRPKTAWFRVYEGRKSLWVLSHEAVVERALRNAYFADRGLVSLKARFRGHWAAICDTRQLTLFDE